MNTHSTHICEACDGNNFRRKHSPNKWVDRFIALAHTISHWSKDPRTLVGAVAVSDAKATLATGYNGLPRGVKDLPERMEAPAKYLWTAHAEENLVANAARAVLEGSTVYVTHMCCAYCARMLINAGVEKVIVGSGSWSAKAEHEPIVKTMFQEAGVIFKLASEVA
jgi:dCMP deaminase